MKEEYGVFFGMGRYTQEELDDLENRIVEITPKIEELEIVKIVREAKKNSPNVRIELVKIIKNERNINS